MSSATHAAATCSSIDTVPEVAARPPASPALEGLKLVRLLQLVSPALPVGGYSYSQGLESAVAAGLVVTPADARSWIGAILLRFMARNEAPLMLLAISARVAFNWPLLAEINAFSIASRETGAARDETRQMGWSLAQLARQLGWFEAPVGLHLDQLGIPAFSIMFALCGDALGLEPDTVVSAYLFSWLENQVIALQKLAAVGQTAGQGLLQELAALIPAVVDDATARAGQGLSAVETLAPHLGILQARHETQYSRIFRT